MVDFGFDKLMLIGAVALIVIGPEKLPRVARMVGHFIGKAQRYDWAVHSRWISCSCKSRHCTHS